MPREETMNQTKQKLQADYVVRFFVAAGSTAVSAGLARMIMLGRTGDHTLDAMFVAAVCGIAGWKMTVNLCARYKQLKQLDVLQRHGPYGTTEYVSPQVAGRQVNDGDDLNMWGTQ
jgi:hypothetical protein